MIAEENQSYSQQPNISVSRNKILSLVVELMKKTVPHFKNYILKDFHKKKKLNEDEFTQFFVEQLMILSRQENKYPFLINSQCRDVYHLSKGIPDIYFFTYEQGKSTEPIFLVECKRLPAPSKNREKEYVIGNNNNGGIERYKTEKHGKGLKESGLLAFVEKENFPYWKKKINKWIVDIASENASWSEDEVLSEVENKIDYCLLKSLAYRKKTNIKINLTHLWINLN